jgi:hypothetical protein
MIGYYDLEVAKNIWKLKIQSNRAAEFEKNDIAFRDAMLANDQESITKATNRRDELRAIGDKITQANTIEELKAIVP